MKVLMIDDEKCPSSFKKNDKEKFTKEEVVIARNYSDGLTELIDNGPWDVLLIDWNLREFSASRNGITILSYMNRRNIKVGKIIIITSDEKKAKEMSDICVKLKESNNIDTFSVQTPKGW